MNMIDKYLKYISEQLLNFPSTRQTNSSNCGPSVVKSILLYYGIDVNEDTLAEEMGTSDNGTSPNDIVKAFISRGLKVKKGKMTIDKISKFITEKIPIILCIQAWSKNDINYSKTFKHGHYVVAIGADDKKVYFNDPSIKKDLAYLDHDELMNRWHDVDKNGIRYINFGIAVYGMNPKFKTSTSGKIK